MDAKISGENELRRLYAQPSVARKNIGYTVVRPGGLTRDPPLGVSAVELNQGDTKSGRIARSDVAAICIESLESADAFDTTFEVSAFSLPCSQSVRATLTHPTAGRFAHGAPCIAVLLR